MNAVGRLYLRRMMIASIVYALLIIGTRLLLRQPMNAPFQQVVAVLPMLPVLFGFFALISFVRGIDELQRQIQLEGMAFSLGITGIVTFAIGLLEGTGIPFVSMTWILPMMVALWGIGVAIASRRYQ